MLKEIFDIEKPVIGVLHLLPLPGSPRGRSFNEVLNRAFLDAMLLEEGGVDGIIVENLGDAPYPKDKVDYSVVAYMTAILKELRLTLSIPVGVNILRNAVDAAIAVAKAGGGKFVRANVWMGVYVTGEGIIEGRADEFLRYRKFIGADDVKIFADFRVKHASPLVARELEIEVKEFVERGLVDALIVTGSATGVPPSPKYVGRIKTLAEKTPVLVGSGVTYENVAEFMEVADGVIIASYFKIGGKLSLERIRKFMSAVKKLR